MALLPKIPIAPQLRFMSHRRLFFGFSTALMLASILVFLVNGLNFGVDFRGGILIEVRTAPGIGISDLRARVSGLDVGEVTLQEFGDPEDILVNVARQEGEEGEQIKAINTVKEALGDSVAEYRRVEFVGPKVGEELKTAGLLATLLALVGIGAYIGFRFEWHYAAAALIALAHDVISTIGFFSLTQVEFNLATLAAVLTVAGYSINDTVVIFDRVREMVRRYKKMPVDQLLDMSINRTLSRTVLTSFTTLLALFALFIFGGEVIRGFTMGLIWGIVIGTYSSVGLAVPLLSLTNLRPGAKRARGGAKDAIEDASDGDGEDENLPDKAPA
ncbi:MAG TPA: protein translocase subunit SecF [Kiloniellaceae bacterium]|nr:protein translocase subunit SecF [Kiloniellaceae bacterium]